MSSGAAGGRQRALWLLPVIGVVTIVVAAAVTLLTAGIGCSLPWDVMSYYGAPRAETTAWIWGAFGVWLLLGWWPFALGWKARRDLNGVESAGQFWWRTVRAGLYGTAWVGISSLIPAVFFSLPAGSDMAPAPGCVSTSFQGGLLTIGAISLVAAILIHTLMWAVAAAGHLAEGRDEAPR